MTERPEVESDVPDETTEPGVTSDRDAGPGGLRSLVNMSRRKFLATGSAGVAAAGLAASIPGLPGILSSGEADAPAATSGASAAVAAAPEVEGEAGGVGQMVAHVSDLSTGEMRIFAGNQTLTLRDPALARSLAQAAKAAGG